MTDTTLRSDLAADTGAGLIGFAHDNQFPAGSVGEKLLQSVVVTDRPWLCPTDGVADAASVINAAMSYVASQGGGTVFLPVGLYCLNGSLSVPRSVTLAGLATGPFESTQNPSSVIVAPTLLIRQSSAVAINLTATSSRITDLLIFYPDQVPVSASTPNPYPYTVLFSSGCGSQSFERCTIVNAYDGLNIRSGRSLVANCLIGAFHNDINIDEAYDWVELSNVKCQIMWDVFSGALKLGQPIDTWVMNNAIALSTKRVDSLQAINLSVFGRYAGHAITLSDNTSLLQRAGYGRLTNVDFDYVTYGVSAGATNESAYGFCYDNMSIGANGSGVGPAPQSAIITSAGAPAGSQPIITWNSGHQRGAWAAGSLPITRNAGRVYTGNVRGINPFGAVTTPAVPTSGTAVTNNYPFAVRIGMAFGGSAATGISINGVGAGVGGTSAFVVIAPGETIAVNYAGSMTWQWFGL